MVVRDAFNFFDNLTIISEFHNFVDYNVIVQLSSTLEVKNLVPENVMYI